MFFGKVGADGKAEHGVGQRLGNGQGAAKYLRVGVGAAEVWRDGVMNEGGDAGFEQLCARASRCGCRTTN